MQQHGCKFLARRPPSTLGVKIQFFQSMVMFHVEGNQECSNMVANILPAEPPRPPPSTLEVGSIGKTSTFSEHGHVAYQIKGNHNCSNMVNNYLSAVPHTDPGVAVNRSKFNLFRAWSCSIIN